MVIYERERDIMKAKKFIFLRSGNYNSDIAKAFDCPIIHINGDNPEVSEFVLMFSKQIRKKINSHFFIACP